MIAVDLTARVLGVTVRPGTRGSSAASAAARLVPSLGRSEGSFESIRATSSSRSSGTSGHSALIRGVSPNTILPRTLSALSPSNAGLPVRHRNSTHPSANTSARASIAVPPSRACSGAM